MGFLLDWLLNRERREYLDRQVRLGLLLAACNGSGAAQADPTALDAVSPALSEWLSGNFSPDHRVGLADVELRRLPSGSCVAVGAVDVHVASRGVSRSWFLAGFDDSLQLRFGDVLDFDPRATGTAAGGV